MSELEPTKPGPHRWTKGQPSANPKGRPRGALAFAERVRLRVEPDRLIDAALRVIDDPEATHRDVLAAATFLHASAWQKPAERHELSQGAPDDDDDVDLSHLSIEQLRELAELQRRVGALVTPPKQPALVSGPGPDGDK